MIDAHVHIWDPRKLTYPWLRGLATLDRPMLPEEFDGDAEVVVFVQADCLASQSIAEVAWVRDQGWPALGGIVAAADLRSPRLSEHLDDLAGSGLVVGVRHLLQGEDERGWVGDAALRDGLRALADRGLTFDACVRAHQLDALATLLEQTPELRVVLDHLGKPPVDDGVDCVDARQWRAALSRVAERPLSFVKLSGLAAESSDRSAFDRNAAGFVRIGLELFGSARAMIGSDWPVSSRLGAAEPPNAWRDRVLAVVAALGGDVHEVGSRTASRFYGIDDRGMQDPAQDA